jgi:hypothetical protein
VYVAYRKKRHKNKNKNAPGDDKFAIYKTKFTTINVNPMLTVLWAFK